MQVLARECCNCGSIIPINYDYCIYCGSQNIRNLTRKNFQSLKNTENKFCSSILKGITIIILSIIGIISGQPFLVILGIVFIIVGLFNLWTSSDNLKYYNNSINNFKCVSLRQGGVAKKISAVCPENCFSTLFNSSISSVLEMTTYSATSTTVSLAEAVKKEKEFREKKFYSNTINNIKTKEELMDYIKILFDFDIWPDEINKRLNEFFKDNKKIKSKLQSYLDEYTEYYYQAMTGKISKDKNSTNQAAIDSKKVKTSGLGFGLITTSTGKALMYSAMDTSVRKKQKKIQNANIASSLNSKLARNLYNFYDVVCTLYDNYKNVVTKEINSMIDFK